GRTTPENRPHPARLRRVSPPPLRVGAREMTRTLLALIRRDFRLAVRAGGGFGLPLVFFLSVVAVTPFAVGPDLVLLARIGAALLWIGALLAMLIGLDRMFGADAED